MTQLVELQNALPLFADAGIKLYAISYDDVAALEAFAEARGITYDLLSDEGSATIREFGILNHHIPETEVPFHGIPFPGTYLVDEDGIITAKAFHRHLAQRESPEGLIDAALGEVLLRGSEPSTANEADGSGISFSMAYRGGGGVSRVGQIRHLVVRADLPDGLHIYDEPVPTGMQATTFTLVGPDGFQIEPVEAPPTEPLDLPGVGELQVWSGTVDFVIPIWASSDAVSETADDATKTATIELDVAYQACDDEACRLPTTTRLSVTVPVDPVLTSTPDVDAERPSFDQRKWMTEKVVKALETVPDPDAAMAFLATTNEHLQANREMFKQRTERG